MKRVGAQHVIFASSLHIYGITRDQAPPRRVTDPPRPIGNYARHKVACERLVRESGLIWSVFRFAAALPFSLRLDGAMFEIPLENRIEYVHHRDVALALAKGVDCPGIWGRTLHIGGGRRCQYTYGAMVRQILDAVGVGMLPDEAFSRKPFSTDWIDTRESQKLLDYQRSTLEDFTRELAGRLGVRRAAARMFAPIARALLLRRSPYYAARHLERQQKALWGKLAFVSCAADGLGEAAARRLAQAGMRVVLLQRPGDDLSTLAGEIRAEGGVAEVLTGDLSTVGGADELFQRLLERSGPPDVLLAHADLVWLDSQGQPDWTRSWAFKLLGTIRFGELVIEAMKNNGGGHYVVLEPALTLFPIRPSPLLQGLRALFAAYWKAATADLRGGTVRASLVKVGISTTELFSIRRLLAALRRRVRWSSRLGVEVRPEDLANRIWMLLIQPQPVVYVPRVMVLVSWMDRYAGWILARIRERLLPSPARAGTR
jgi:NADP-dependent 3-hydroxy acid dehydrogenase YdfG